MFFPDATIARGTTAFTFLAVLAFAGVPATAATCSNASLSGTYGFVHGISAISIKVAGQFEADGKGGLSGTYTESYSGRITTGTFTGTYSISPDCTGALTFSKEMFSPTSYDIVLNNDNRNFQLIEAYRGYNQNGYGVAQGASSCKPVNQTLAVNLFTAYPTPKAWVGQWILDEDGNISGVATEDLDGSIIPSQSVTGKYTVNADCTGTITVTPSKESTMHFNTVTVDDGKEILLIDSDNDVALLGTAQQ
jgi:hypothetical protein